MSSKPRTHLAGLALCGAVVVGALGCGHKAAPFPPPLENPARTADLTVQQRGQTAILSFTYPQTTVSGTLLEPLERVEVYRVPKDVFPPIGDETSDEETAEDESSQDAESSDSPAAPSMDPDSEDDGEPAADDQEAEDGDESEPAAEQDSEPETPAQPLEVLAAVDPVEFVATAQLADTFNATAIEQATHGEKLVFRVELEDAAHEETAHTFAIKTYSSEILVSAFSNLATLVQRDPPPPPTDFLLAGEAKGVKLTWAAIEEEENAPTAIMVYRRSATSRVYDQPLVRLPGIVAEYLDSSAVFGERYIYAVTAVGHPAPIVESFFGGEREIGYTDVFAPSAPTDLIALAEAERVRVLWTASTEDDVVGYVVFRRQAGGDFRRLTDEPIVDVEYSDRTVEAGATYDYRVAAVDRVGNQSEPGTSVVARVP